MGQKKGIRWKKNIISYILSAVCVVTVLFSNSVPAYAASAQSYIACPTQVTVGDTFTATFTIESEGDSLGLVYGTITYDSSILSCNGYAGTINIPETVPGDADEVFSYQVSYTFQVIAAGRASLGVNFGLETLRNGEILNNIASGVAITASNPYVASSNCALTSLQTSEGFVDVAKRNFTINVPNATTTFALNPTLADPTASWGVVSGAQYLDALQEGTNVIVLRVTAEDKVTYEDYTFNVVRAAAATPTPGPTSTPTPTPTPTAVPEKIPVDMADGSQLFIDFSDVTAPEGFEEDTYPYRDKTVPAAVLGHIVLLPLADEEGESLGWYLYDEEMDRCAPYRVIENAALSYMILDVPKEFACPYGYEEGTLLVQDTVYRIYQSAEHEGEMLCYLLNSEGEKGLYRYNEKSGQLYPYVQDAYEPTVPDTEEEPSEEDNTLLKEKEEQYQTLLAEYEALKKQSAGKNLLLLLALVLLVILLGAVLLVLFIRNKEDDLPDDPDDDSMDDPEDDSPDDTDAAVAIAPTEAALSLEETPVNEMMTGQEETPDASEELPEEQENVPETADNLSEELPRELQSDLTASIGELMAAAVVDEEEEADDILIVNGVEAPSEELSQESFTDEAHQEENPEGEAQPEELPEELPDELPEELPEKVTEPKLPEEADGFPEAEDVPDLDDIGEFEDVPDLDDIPDDGDASETAHITVPSEKLQEEAEKQPEEAEKQPEEPGKLPEDEKKFQCHYEDDDEEDGEWILDPDDEEL